MNEGFLHGWKQKAGRAAWAKELAYLHVEVDEAGDCWATLFKTNQEEDNRATTLHSPEEGEPSTAQLGVNVNARVEDIDMTDSEHASLRQMVLNWVAARKEVVDLDGDGDEGEEESGGGGESDGHAPPHGEEGGGAAGDDGVGSGGGCGVPTDAPPGGGVRGGYRSSGGGFGAPADAPPGGGGDTGAGGGIERGGLGKELVGLSFPPLPSVPRRSGAGVGRVPNWQRHPFDRSESEEEEVGRPKHKVWERRRFACAAGAAGRDSMSSDSEFSPSAVGTESNSSWRV